MERHKNYPFEFKNKRVLVMGLGLHGGGVETVKFLAGEGAKITVTDLRTRKILLPSLQKLKKIKHVRYVLGRHVFRDFKNTDIIVKNPGVSPHSPYLTEVRKSGVYLTSDIGIFFARTRGRIIGVSGTRGKSTTAYLIWKFLKNAGKRAFLGGNIRTSVFELLPKVKEGDWVVLELSSFQLEDLSREKLPRKSPEIAVLTNILRDHLNRHGTMRLYIRVKSHLFRFQKPDDRLFLNADDAALKSLAKSAPGKVIFARLPKKIVARVDKNLGAHYRGSVGLAYAVGKFLGISENILCYTLDSFSGLEGRGEEVRVLRGIHFINDTTATIPEASIAAINRFRKKAGRCKLILIAGGQNKKLNFREFAKKIIHDVDILIFLPGSATDKISKEMKIKTKKPRVVYSSSMKEAVKKAYLHAAKGDYIVLSPGAASFGLFLNEFDRGDRFTDIVSKLR